MVETSFKNEKSNSFSNEVKLDKDRTKIHDSVFLSSLDNEYEVTFIAAVRPPLHKHLFRAWTFSVLNLLHPDHDDLVYLSER